jgi:hypothetical protein
MTSRSISGPEELDISIFNLERLFEQEQKQQDEQLRHFAHSGFLPAKAISKQK